MKLHRGLSTVIGVTISLAVALPTTTSAFEISQSSTPSISQPPSQLVPSETLASYPKGYFLENIVVDIDGTIYITENSKGQIIRRKADGGADIFTQLEVGLAGLALDIDGTLIATGHAETGEQYIFQIADDGTLDYELIVPQAGFLNGLTLLRPGVFLIADSNASTIWRFDSATRQITSWLQHDSLAPDPNSEIPAANGIKLFDGAVYVSNSAQATVVRIPILEEGAAGQPEIAFSDVVIDDFAFSSTGDLYGTTHLFDSVVSITPDGERRTIATAEQGVTGSTALAFGTTPGARNSVYVVGDGGIFGASSEDDIVQPKLVRLDVGELGITQAATLDWMKRPQQIEAVESQLVQCQTAPNTADLRITVGPQYLRYLELNSGQISYAGQLYENGRNNPPNARLYFVKNDDADAALEIIQSSPYYRSGVYSTCTVSPFSALLGNSLGGVAWPSEAIYPSELSAEE